MGSTPVTWPKTIVYSNPVSKDFNEMQVNSAFNQPQVFHNMMGPPVNDNSSNLTRVKCQGVNTVCERRRDDGNGNLTDWLWAEATNNGQFNDPVCQEAYNTYGNPCGGNQSRSLPTQTEKNRRGLYVAVGIGTLVLVGVAIWAAKSNAK